VHVEHTKKTPTSRSGFDRIFHDHYKLLFIITLGFLAFALITLGVTYARTGEIFAKGVSLSGGITITVPSSDVDATLLEQELALRFPEADINVREVSDLGRQIAFVVEAAPPKSEQEDLIAFEGAILDMLEEQRPDTREIASTEIIGSSLGESFFRQTAKAVLIAFTFMGLVVFLYFGKTKTQKIIVFMLTFLEALLIWYASSIIVIILALIVGVALVIAYVRFSIPSAAVILAAISTIVFTLAVVNIMGMRLSTAGIAAFLMLIGYSVDTDILLTTRFSKASNKYEGVKNALKTGLTMECSTAAAALVALIFTRSDVIREIMTIVFIGLIADIFFTWIQNAGILRLHHERRGVRRG